MKHNLDKLVEGFNQWNIHISDAQLCAFHKYLSLLLQWNKKMNLTAISDPEEVIVKHFLDSLSLLKSGFLDDEGPLVDVGTGAGFPGIPLKIMMPQREILLLDSLNKNRVFKKCY